MKSEPSVYSIEHLQADTCTWWEGIRNYQARNFMVQEMRISDQVLFYHSNAEPPGIAGLATISQLAQPDSLQYEKKSEYFDAKSSQENPRWFCVQLKFAQKFANIISLAELKKEQALKKMLVLQKGQRLSIQPVTPAEFQHILKMAKK